MQQKPRTSEIRSFLNSITISWMQLGASSSLRRMVEERTYNLATWRCVDWDKVSDARECTYGRLRLRRPAWLSSLGNHKYGNRTYVKGLGLIILPVIESCLPAKNDLIGRFLHLTHKLKSMRPPIGHKCWVGQRRHHDKSPLVTEWERASWWYFWDVPTFNSTPSNTIWQDAFVDYNVSLEHWIPSKIETHTLQSITVSRYKTPFLQHPQCTRNI